MASIKRVKKKEHENLSDSNVEKVIGLLEQDKPITKKDACEILNISYNTTRLKNIIDGHKARKAHDQKMRDKNRGKKATKEEISEIVNSYLSGENVSEIAKSLFRSASFIKSILDRIGVPQKAIGEEKYKVGILPEQCVSDEFNPGQVVWSAKYHAPCEIINEVDNAEFYINKYGCKCYKVWVIEYIYEPIEFFPNIKKGGFFANCLACELGSLEHLKEYGIKV